MLIAVAVVISLFIVGIVAYKLAPNPTREVVERRLREKLPPGYEELRVFDYDQRLGQLKFDVLYRDNFAPLGVRYSVSRFDAMEFSQGGAGQRVEVEGRKLMIDVPFERWLVVRATFDPSGKIVRATGLTTAGPAEAAANEARARQLALVVHGLY
ncbi:MAG TPA: hypothetical protein VD866_31375 [Urbifossiella sp.]|nr:hypothetical protein [Urbifossiella sp.]